MYASLGDSPHLDYDVDCYSPSYIGFSGPYMHEMPELLENRDLQQTPLYPDNIDVHICKDLADYSATKEPPSTESQGLTPQVSHISNYSYRAAGNPSYCFTDGGSCINSALDSIHPGSKYLSNLSMENDTDQAADSARNTVTPSKDIPISEHTTGVAPNVIPHRHSSESRIHQTIPPPLPDPFCDPVKELACSSMLEQTPLYLTGDREQSGSVDITADFSLEREGHPRPIHHSLHRQSISYHVPTHTNSTLPFLLQGTPQQYTHQSSGYERSSEKHHMHKRYIMPAEKPYMYSYTEQSSIHRQMNYQLFLRSYQYFYGLDDEEIDLHQEALVTRDSVLGPQYASQDRVTSSTLYKGLFCANKECCGLLIDNLTRSPYCSKQCQVREQNMRQARVKPRETLIRRKDSLFRLLRTLPGVNFERAQLIPLVRNFLRGGLTTRLKQTD
ncbi:hypothetical protein GL50803_0010680 [Giardia duodenalis]|uniref:Uncharacterized protein n=1 Tax=Giardia intestinalis (strain ATCC 50803 / WB clone C6) TaxID=184922 RepID=A8B957_GIAIC|nr:hypothetical protein GL50803_0010680 [Giardia intestinalis]KAE8302324.1 hypothetical protein GL50803_0010680 [Giardia intestinalis]|eukprot:XP_001708773.1 Hypothetical protein GL50803_10680 [Giardia lamblia ATCC 50803]